MSLDFVYRQNTADIHAIATHLRACDQQFVPPLSGRVDITAYAEKIASKAERFEASSGGQLIGLVAAYCNDPLRKIAYVTSVSVLPAWRGQQVASRLIEKCIEHAKAHGFSGMELKVSESNGSAIKLYQAHGFVVDSRDGNWTTMRLSLGNG